MAKKRKKQKKEALEYIALPKLNLEANVRQSILIITIFVVALLSLFGLFDLGGQTGNYFTQILGLAFGWGKWIFPFLLFIWGALLYQGRKAQVKTVHYTGLVVLFLTYQSLFHFFFIKENWSEIASAKEGGGYLGLYLSMFFYSLFGFWGGLIVILALFMISWVLILNRPISRLLPPGSWLKAPFKVIGKFLGRLFSSNREVKEGKYKEVSQAELFLSEEVGDEEDEEENKEIVFAKKAVASRKAPPNKSAKIMKKPDWKSKGVRIDLPIDLLKQEDSKASGGNLEQNASIIKQTLENFGVSVDMGPVSVGPTVTQYTFKPTEGVKLSRITTLSNDLSLSLAAHPLRIEAPIPGKSLVGVEVPNKTKAIVGLRSMIDSTNFKTRSSNLMMALGRDVSGESWFYDISKMPHLLVAGATNSGKSVCLNTIIISLLYQNNPDDLRFIMVDPKRVELPMYNDIPHLLTPVITDVNKTINALKWCLNEMDRRFEVLSEAKKKNISSYNQDLEAKGKKEDKMPYIVFIIDELADLMVAAAKDIEGSVIRLAQMARAVGIHLVLATQRPSVDVITGLIKANIPARIAFSVTSAVDSKTIIDISGAEKLLGQGDMLVMTPVLSKPKRLQGAFVSDKEIKNIASYLKKKIGKADYLDDVTERQKVKGLGGIGLDGMSGNEDELLEEAKDIVINMGKASTSLLQRRLRIGYGRAASILDTLEEAGIVGPSNGSKPREILISREQYEAILDQGVSGVSLHNKEEASEPEDYLIDETEKEVEDEVEKVQEVEETKEKVEKTEVKKEKTKSDDKEPADSEEWGDDGMYFSR